MHFLSKNIFKIKNQVVRPKAMHFFRQLQKEASLTPEARDKLIFSRLAHIVKLAFDHTEFYRKKYSAAGLTDGVIRTMSDFEQLPPLSREDLRNHFDDIVNSTVTPGNCRTSTTGGSSGVPVKVLHDRRVPTDVFSWYVLNQWGGDISDNVGFLARYNPQKTRIPYNKLIWYPTSRCFIDVSMLTAERFEQFYKECLRISPQYLQGYVGAVQEFAGFLEKNNLVLPSVKFVWTTSAPLSESNRAYMERIFKAPVYSQYGCCEVFWLAYECKVKNGLHYFDTARHFDVCDSNLKPVPDDTEGELLLTDMLNYSFPIIRYRNGDRVCKLSRSCCCGCGFPLIGKVKGRMTDIIRLPDGSSVPGDFMTTLFDDFPEAVAGFQVIQHADFSLTLRYVAANDSSALVVESVCEKLRKRFEKNAIIVNSEAVDCITHDRGKIRFVVSELK